MTEKKEKRQVDWVAITPDWRAGIKTKLQMSEEHGVSRAAMDKHFAKAGIERDLTKRIQDKADALVAQAAVTQGVTPATTRIEKDVVDANADLQVHVRMGHRKDIGRARNLFSRLLDELELTTDNRALFEQLGEMLDGSAPGKPDKLNEIYRKVISMTGRVDSAKKLTEMLEKVVRLEREAFGIDKDQDTENPVDKALKAIAEMRKNGVRPDA